MHQRLTPDPRSRATAFALVLTAATAVGQTRQYDFGAAGTEAGYVAVGNTTTWTSGMGHGWTSTTGLNLRDRGGPDDLHRDFIFKNTSGSNVFRVSGLTANAKYLLKVTCGDASYGDHVITVSVPGAGTLPTMSPNTSEFETLNASVDADASGYIEITFGSPTTNWVVNAITLEPTAATITPFIESQYLFNSTWDPAVFATNPTTGLLAGFDGTGAVGSTPTGLTRADYLTLIAGEIDFWKTKQSASGAIIDPYANSEIQYSTPAFANAAAALVVYAGRNDLLEPAAKAMDKASLDLHNKTAAGAHEDFYAPMVANAYRLLSPLVTPTRAATWASNLDFDPYAIYRADLNDFNWNMISSSGEALFQLQGLRPSTSTYVDASWGRQGHHFSTPYGLYLEGPMCYDTFPRLFVTDAIERGYVGQFSPEMSEAMDRAAVTNLFMQSPAGELPSGGRSAHHQWNEAEQCVIYEIYAARAETAGNPVLAAAYKRAAHLSLASMFRWVRPSGEMQIIKNWMDPASRYAYEGYSYHSQYNLLPSAMLAIAYEHAAPSEDVTEGPAPADTGGFVFALDRLDIPNRPHKIFANAGGTYLEINSFHDGGYDAIGLVRVHQAGLPPQVGLTDSLIAAPAYNSPVDSPITTGAGVSWQNSSGVWQTLGAMTSSQVTSIVMTPVSQSTSEVVFDVTYSGSLPNATSITEHYVVTPAGVQLTSTVNGYSGPLRYHWPVLSNDGQTTSSIQVAGNTVSVSQGGPKALFTATGASSVSVGGTDYSNHNGWARLATAEYPSGGAVTLVISKAEATIETSYWKGDVDADWNTNNAGNTNWSSDVAGSIDSGVVPGINTNVVFSSNGAATAATTVLGDNLAVRGVTVTTPDTVGIGGTHSLTLGEGGLSVQAGAGATSFQPSGQLILGADQVWTNESANAVTVDRAIDSSGGTRSLTLEGTGAFMFGNPVVADVHVQPGPTVRIGGEGFPLVDAITRIDDFDSYNNSAFTTIGAHGNGDCTAGVWDGVFDGTANANILDVAGSGQVLNVIGIPGQGTVGWRGAKTDLANSFGSDLTIADQSVTTVFFQFRALSGGGNFDCMFGLTDSIANLDNTNSYLDFAVMPFLSGGGVGAADFKIDNGTSEQIVIPDVAADAWYNVWLVVDTTANTFDVYTSTGTAAGTLGYAGAPFRNGLGLGSLAAFGLSQREAGQVQIDNLFLLHGNNTSYPVGAPTGPVPVGRTLNVSNDFTLAAGATLEFDASTGSLQDKLIVGGQFSANGTLKVSLDPAQPAPVSGDSFDLFDAGTSAIAFASYDLPPLFPGLSWNTSAISDGVISVTGTPDGYWVWAEGVPFPEGTDAPGSDANNNGMANVLEWLFGTPAVDPGPASPAWPRCGTRAVTGGEFPGADPSKHYLQMIATVRKITPGWTLVAQAAASPDLLAQPGSSDHIVSFQTTDLGDFEEREWIHTIAIEDADHGFMRLKLENTP